MEQSSDYLITVLNAFVELTCRIMTSPADYTLAQQWQTQGIPLSCVQRGIEDKLRRCQGKPYTRTMPLAWCNDDVQEQYQNWRRAVGPDVARMQRERVSA